MTTSLPVALENPRDAAADVVHLVLFAGAADEFLVHLPAGADVHVEDVGAARVHLVLVEHRVLGGVHAADLGAVVDAFRRVAAAGAGDEDDLLGDLAVGRPLGYALRRAGGRQQPFERQAGDHILVLAVAVLGEEARRLDLVAGRDDDRADIHLDQLIFLAEADRLRRTGFFADFALAGLVERAFGLVDDRLVRHGLGERDVDRGPQAEDRR